MILFRADGNEIIGSGHIMRCLSIAKAADEVGEECCFVMADRKFASAVEKAGFPYISLNTNFRDMQEELNVLLPILEKEKPFCVVVDSYYVTDVYLQKIRTYASVAYMDDLALFAYPVDLLVNYNIYGEKINYIQMYQNQNSPLPKLLLGPGYAPLRKEFMEIKRKRQSEKVKDILVSTGGADHEHMALGLVHYIASHENCNLYKYHFVIGAMNSDASEIKKIGEKLSGRIVIHQNVKEMEQLMQNCDMAISAAGSTLYELCACGIPTITYVLADNQIMGSHAFEERGLMQYAGDCRNNKDFAGQILKAAAELAENYHLREQMANDMYALVKGNGAEKIMGELMLLGTAKG